MRDDGEQSSPTSVAPRSDHPARLPLAEAKAYTSGMVALRYEVRGQETLMPKKNQICDVRLQRQGEPRRRRHVADRLRANEADRRRRGEDWRPREESSELT